MRIKNVQTSEKLQIEFYAIVNKTCHAIGLSPICRGKYNTLISKQNDAIFNYYKFKEFGLINNSSSSRQSEILRLFLKDLLEDLRDKPLGSEDLERIFKERLLSFGKHFFSKEQKD
ncbi:MAG: hypothetical protein JSS09_09740 [Verrucomicrobia bacterium]|nr:hypothetical protein [Verrucomicrobiota bacterium]